MFVGLIALFLAVGGFTALSIFRPHLLINLSIIILSLGIIVLYDASGYQGAFWVTSAIAFYIAYQCGEIPKNWSKIT